jgi:hypothetical protein
METLKGKPAHNSGFKKWRKICEIHAFLSQEILSYWKNSGYEVRHFMKPPNVMCQLIENHKQNKINLL